MQISLWEETTTGYVTHKSDLPADTITELTTAVLFKWLATQIQGYVSPRYMASYDVQLGIQTSIYISNYLLSQGQKYSLGQRCWTRKREYRGAELQPSPPWHVSISHFWLLGGIFCAAH